ncbi:hypothetical protein RCL_jg11389.t1 [Rhizophagus clarus]|uniref:Uncharacterized protein n=1 Tax=Rhizophagus clarus TaxID=94130 RepID=A0A8H3LAB9_9GLOM|nr:hypothetical protein RCL_jg11389.t1 [Rhizophagus clarus]
MRSQNIKCDVEVQLIFPQKKLRKCPIPILLSIALSFLVDSLMFSRTIRFLTITLPEMEQTTHFKLPTYASAGFDFCLFQRRSPANLYHVVAFLIPPPNYSHHYRMCMRKRVTCNIQLNETAREKKKYIL